MDIYLEFANPTSEAYREKLQAFSDSILVQEITENRPPRIRFPGIYEETFFGIDELRSDYDNRHELN